MANAASNPYGYGFVGLSPTTFYRIPPDNAKSSGASIAKEPHLILLASWLNASPRHVAKYTAGYQKLFPTSRILLVTTSTIHFLIQPTSQRINEFEPALGILENIQPQEEILLHSFSSGGATAVFLIAKTYQTRTGQPLPISKAIFDSSPGTAGYASTVRAFSVTLPKNIIAWGIGAAFLRVLFGIWFFVETVTARENIVDVVRKGLNNEKLFAAKVARLYIYSRKDEMIRWQDVEAHADEAHAKGYKVEKVRYLDSVHAGHLLQDEGRYWSAVTRLWDSEYLTSPGLIVVAW
ncbi:Eukaryotic protein of unknown function (DUF829) domain containing protein [Elaphomyces granulatus]|jgi:hypothetical protein